MIKQIYYLVNHVISDRSRQAKRSTLGEVRVDVRYIMDAEKPIIDDKSIVMERPIHYRKADL